MISGTYLYLILTSIGLSFLLFFYFNFRPYKSEISNKILLKNLLESFDLDLPDELKSLDNSSTDPQKFS